MTAAGSSTAPRGPTASSREHPDPRGKPLPDVYYTSHLPTAAHYAGYGHPLKEGRDYQDLSAEARPGHVYEVQPEDKNGRRIGRHVEDPMSGVPGELEAYRTGGRLRVLREVDRETGEPLDAEGSEYRTASTGLEVVAHFGGDLPFAREGDEDFPFDHPEYGYEDDEFGYRHPKHGWHCSACDSFHDDPETARDHDTSHTDWDEEYPRLPGTMHRGLLLSAQGDGRQLMHRYRDEGHDPASTARDLLQHVGHAGEHWTPEEGQARHYAVAGGGRPEGHDMNVVIHARKPDREHIETDPGTLAERGVYGMDYHEDREIPLKSGAPVHVTGVSWKFHDEPGDAWRRHDLEDSVEHTAALEAAAPSTRRVVTAASRSTTRTSATAIRPTRSARTCAGASRTRSTTTTRPRPRTTTRPTPTGAVTCRSRAASTGASPCGCPQRCTPSSTTSRGPARARRDPRPAHRPGAARGALDRPRGGGQELGVCRGRHVQPG